MADCSESQGEENSIKSDAGSFGIDWMLRITKLSGGPESSTGMYMVSLYKCVPQRLEDMGPLLPAERNQTLRIYGMR
jgi:hypothetical protein